MFKFWNPPSPDASGLLTSGLFDQNTFYEAFLKDLHSCRSELIIESPFITTKRISAIFPKIERLRKRGIKIIINTRDPIEHEGIYQFQAEDAIARLQAIGVHVLYTGGHHRKIVILDKNILWEGSLNVLSQNDTCEMMRRIVSSELAQQMINFLHIEPHLVQ